MSKRCWNGKGYYGSSILGRGVGGSLQSFGTSLGLPSKGGIAKTPHIWDNFASHEFYFFFVFIYLFILLEGAMEEVTIIYPIWVS